MFYQNSPGVLSQEVFQLQIKFLTFLYKFMFIQIIEQQTEVYFKTDPDPFDDRHPGRADPNCTLGHALKIMLKQDDFIQSVCICSNITAINMLLCSYI